MEPIVFQQEITIFEPITHAQSSPHLISTVLSLRNCVTNQGSVAREAMTVTLQAGEVLFVPRHWWHDVWVAICIKN